MVKPLVVEIKGPGHHERSEFARSVVNAIANLGKVVAVEADLRPRLAADLTEMLGVGAKEVLLYAKGMMAKVVLGPEMATRSDLERLHDPDVEVIVRLVPSDGVARASIGENQDKVLELVISQALKEAQVNMENS